MFGPNKWNTVILIMEYCPPRIYGWLPQLSRVQLIEVGTLIVAGVWPFSNEGATCVFLCTCISTVYNRTWMDCVSTTDK